MTEVQHPPVPDAEQPKLFEDPVRPQEQPDHVLQPLPERSFFRKKWVQASGATALVVAMGVGAFAYTRGSGNEGTNVTVTDPVENPGDPGATENPEENPEEQSEYVFGTYPPLEELAPDKVPYPYLEELWQYDQLEVNPITSEDPNQIVIDANRLASVVLLDHDEEKAMRALDVLATDVASGESERVRDFLLEMRQRNIREKIPELGGQHSIGSYPNARIISDGPNYMVIATFNVLVMVTLDKGQLAQEVTRGDRGPAYYYIRVLPDGQKKVLGISDLLTTWKGQPDSFLNY